MNTKKQELMKQMQLMCHKEGVEEFISMVVEVLNRAADDTEDFDVNYTSEHCRTYAAYLTARLKRKDNMNPENKQEYQVGDEITFTSGPFISTGFVLEYNSSLNLYTITMSYGISFVKSEYVITRTILEIPKCECGNSDNPKGQGHSSWCNCFKLEF